MEWLIRADDNGQELVLVRGLPGSGKSTYARSLGYPNFEADMFFIKDGKYVYNPAQISIAHGWCQKKASEALAAGQSCVVSNTFTTKREMEPYFEMGRKFNVPVRVVASKGQWQNQHGVPDEAMTRMKARWENIPGETIING